MQRMLPTGKEKEPDATLPPIVASNHNVTTRFLRLNYNILIFICKGGNGRIFIEFFALHEYDKESGRSGSSGDDLMYIYNFQSKSYSSDRGKEFPASEGLSTSISGFGST